MRKPRMKDKKSLYLVLGLLVFSMLCLPACATTDPNYSYHGFPLTTVESGIVQGDVYVNCGDHAGLNTTAWNYTTNTFITNFSNVPTENIKWAELKVGVWGGSPARVGYVNTTLSDNADTLALGETRYLDITNLPDDVSCAGSGVYLIAYNCTQEIQTLANSNIKATVTAWPELGLGDNRRLDSRIYGAVLIVVYEDGTSYTQYWINQGDLNLHKNGTATIDNTSYSFQDLDANITEFNGDVDEGVSGAANLTVGYFAGDPNQTDYLYFNALPDTNSPYNLLNPAWNRTAYSDKLVGQDVANSMSNTAYNFDLKSFDVTSMKTDSDNYAIFWRGHSDTIPIYDPAWPGVNNETEGYYTPFLAVLKIK